MQPTIIRAAELIQTLTDTTLAAQTFANDNSAQAERHARRSMWVAVFSIFIAVIAGGFSIYYAKLSPTAEQLDLLAKEQRMQFTAMSESAHSDRIALEEKFTDDRKKSISAMSEQLELIKRMRAAENKVNKTNSGAKR
ncbi:hypothetical protein [Janthinobacterium sp. PAMC25594]|uniref:hypothetical protein n=1 Tax=Janthinobacterium sp. PAMC25594 TaxID=2861284 RepID=UPI001C624B5A|nr:hypothetical protein [Janthinobacterium sp. PAMC25594]QYG05987.1 hypothetical protein KY494_22250 [Janthinobacterium sp. PAMC25594]